MSLTERVVCMQALYEEYNQLKQQEEVQQQQQQRAEGGENAHDSVEAEEHEALRRERRRRFCECIKNRLTRKQALRVQSKLNNFPPDLASEASAALDERLAQPEDSLSAGGKSAASDSEDDSSSDEEKDQPLAQQGERRSSKQQKIGAHATAHKETNDSAPADTKGTVDSVEAAASLKTPHRRTAVLDDDDDDDDYNDVGGGTI